MVQTALKENPFSGHVFEGIGLEKPGTQLRSTNGGVKEKIFVFLVRFHHAVKRVRYVRVQWMPPHRAINSIPKH